jgi:glycosyltransferase involved in cell wall biosynthesis
MAHLVSILIPAYNAEKWIGDTIKSALAQTWQNKEVIVVDDGSTDETLNVAKSFKCKAVKVITQKNTGACGARNRALSYAQGDFIQWLDADDLLHPEKIALQLERIGQEVGTTILLTCGWGKFFFRWQKTKFISDSLWQDLTPVDWIMNKFTDNVWMNPAVWLVSRRLTERAGLWDERLSMSGDDDGEYICRVVAASEKVNFVGAAKCYYRIGSVGSLDWRMGESQERIESFLLSLNLSIGHLLSLEDSERTRHACVAYLETWLPLFYPENLHMIERINKLAQELGGELHNPHVGLKYGVIKSVFGWSATKKVMRNWRKIKLIIRKKWDKFLYNLVSTKETI